ncbi:hypothetical protein HOLleu_16518 [Holothuria leucospilota]|uniref:Uncharacterized protein n=1 Tax=Holothuria leucospilota TaxID=206669 RepID=A0A9Q1C659_HOLLE|nr:hypothetical protein HOLleu_16518 [Holothuria leucospilota]
MNIYAEVGFYILLLILTAWKGRPYWLLVETGLLFFTGTCYIFFPHFVLDTLTGTMIGEYDSCHYFLLRILGIIFLGSMVVCARGFNYTDDYAQICLLRTYLVATSLETICHIPFLGRTPDPESPLQHIPEASMAGFIFSVAGNVLHLILAENVESRPQNSDPLSKNLRFDSFCMFFLGIAFHAYPTLTLARLTTWDVFGSTHHVIASVIGSYLLGYSYLMFQVPCFKSETDKKILLLGRLVEAVIIIAVILVTSALTTLIPLVPALVAASITAVVAVNAFVGYTLPPEGKNRQD